MIKFNNVIPRNPLWPRICFHVFDLYAHSLDISVHFQEYILPHFGSTYLVVLPIHFFSKSPERILSHLQPMPHFYNPWKDQKTSGFLMFFFFFWSGVSKWNIGWRWVKKMGMARIFFRAKSNSLKNCLKSFLHQRNYVYTIVWVIIESYWFYVAEKICYVFLSKQFFYRKNNAK